MPSVKIPRKSTATDMTPFVDVAFLILAFFMLATKFKPDEVVQITTPKSVSADKLTEENAVHVNFGPDGRVFFSLSVKSPDAQDEIKTNVIQAVNQRRNLGLTSQHIENFKRNTTIGVPFNELKNYLSLSDEQKNSYPFKGVPTDSTNNELAEWIGAAKSTFYTYDKNMKVLYMIKGDNNAKYPAFNGVLEAMRKNDQYSFKLITDPHEAPVGSALYVQRQKELAGD
jgi:biopolymer transport protein ExbD